MRTAPLLSRDEHAAFTRGLQRTAGVALIVASFVIAAALYSYSPADPSPFNATAATPTNLVGSIGADLAGGLATFFGAASWALVLLLLVWGSRLLAGELSSVFRFRVAAAPVALMATAATMSNDGGMVGRYLFNTVRGALPIEDAAGGFALATMICALSMLAAVCFVLGATPRGALNTARSVGDRESRLYRNLAWLRGRLAALRGVDASMARASAWSAMPPAEPRGALQAAPKAPRSPHEDPAAPAPAFPWADPGMRNRPMFSMSDEVPRAEALAQRPFSAHQTRVEPEFRPIESAQPPQDAALGPTPTALHPYDLRRQRATTAPQAHPQPTPVPPAPTTPAVGDWRFRRPQRPVEPQPTPYSPSAADPQRAAHPQPAGAAGQAPGSAPLAQTAYDAIDPASVQSRAQSPEEPLRATRNPFAATVPLRNTGAQPESARRELPQITPPPLVLREQMTTARRDAPMGGIATSAIPTGAMGGAPGTMSGPHHAPQVPPAPAQQYGAPQPAPYAQHQGQPQAQPFARPQPAARPQPSYAPSPAPYGQPAQGFAPAAPAPYTPPPLELLRPADESAKLRYTEEMLAEAADKLQAVLNDYGVRGEIIDVHPGPVVTLYELEPAPGTKASRVIGLADDIARSMSAVSARVSTVPGRNVIGIELPTPDRETVLLRELFEDPSFAQTDDELALALGKDISGEPVSANLARMPHLLIAGTTGSGKSVAINTMILSLLYRLSPAEVRLLMIDPKMLELSVYNDIPHLLAPVVTDPKKAVTALKWVVREMEERYQKMAKLQVRGLDSYNQKVAEAVARGERFERVVQTGFDPETGQPIHETEVFDPEPMPLIVVVVDEMADLMMVAGKEIEWCIQRLAQMARASGIHLIMATQRPSVDVITGTIKANFPIRISFQVTSKIDSRTILGEQGAEQLLGRGDMLYSAGGSRLTRLHGPFVSDEEVATVVDHLRRLGPPDYRADFDDGGPDDDAGGGLYGDDAAEGGADEDALYERAVEIVANERRASTSFVQRRLQIGYNRAARIVDMMEERGVVSPANHVGKREVLVGKPQ